MKTLLLLLFSCAFLHIHAQDTAIYYTRIKNADGLSKAAIYEKAKLWSVSAFKNTAGALQLDDKESGLLAYDASTSELSPNAPPIKSQKEVWKQVPFYHKFNFKFKIQIRDGKYKVDVTDIKYPFFDETHTLTSATKAPFKYTFSKQSKTDQEWADVKITFGDFVEKFLTSLELAINKKADW